MTPMARTDDIQTTPAETRRAEKLQAIAALFGPDLAAQLARSTPIASTAVDRPAEPSAVDPSRSAWQQNRLIQLLRDRGLTPPPAQTAQPADGPETPRGSAQGTGLSRIARDAAPAVRGKLPETLSRNPAADLSSEHPAVIAHILRGETQSVRVSVLKKLPGQTSRAVIQRLRAG